jgi:signal peptidase
MKRRLVTRIAPMAVAALVVACGWPFFGPAELGGPSRYVIIDGSSMEPGLRAGDLVVARVDRDADVGDAVLYRDPTLHVNVLHRIVRKEGGRFVLKGDANDFLDATQPARDEVRGELWFSVPYVGSAVVWTREPVHAAVLVFVLALALLAGGGARRASPDGQPAER